MLTFTIDAPDGKLSFTPADQTEFGLDEAFDAIMDALFPQDDEGEIIEGDFEDLMFIDEATLGFAGAINPFLASLLADQDEIDYAMDCVYGLPEPEETFGTGLFDEPQAVPGDRIIVLEPETWAHGVFTEGKQYTVEAVTDTARSRHVKVIDDEGDQTTLIGEDYRVVLPAEEAEEAPRPLQQGDKVRCTASPFHWYTVGKVYEVDEAKEGYSLRIVADDEGESWFQDMGVEFELVTEEVPYLEFSVGDLVTLSDDPAHVHAYVKPGVPTEVVGLDVMDGEVVGLELFSIHYPPSVYAAVLPGRFTRFEKPRTTQEVIEASEWLSDRDIVKVASVVHQDENAVLGKVGVIRDIDTRRPYGQTVKVYFDQGRHEWLVDPRSLEVLYSPAQEAQAA